MRGTVLIHSLTKEINESIDCGKFWPFKSISQNTFSRSSSGSGGLFSLEHSIEAFAGNIVKWPGCLVSYVRK